MARSDILAEQSSARCYPATPVVVPRGIRSPKDQSIYHLPSLWLRNGSDLEVYINLDLSM